MKKEETIENDTRYIDKTPKKHHFFTLELVRRKLIAGDNEFDLCLFDSLFEDVLRYYEFKTVLIATSYAISCIKRNKFKDEEGQDIECLYAYIKVSLGNSLRNWLHLCTLIG